MAEPLNSTRINRRRFLTLTGATGGATLLAACGFGEGGSSSKSVSYWVPPNAELPQMQAFLDSVKSGYEKAHSGSTLKNVIVPWEEALTKYTAAFSSNNPPDVTYQIIPWMNKWRATGVLTDFNSLDKSFAETFLDGVNPSFVEGAKGPEGELLGLPYVAGYWALVLNENIWDKAGKPELPKTYDAMVPFAQAMTIDKAGRRLGDSGFDARNVEHYGMTWAPSPAVQENYVWHYFWNFGTDYISADGKDIGFNNDAGRAALKHMKDLVDSGAVTPPNLYSDDVRWLAAVMSGKTAMAWSEGLTQKYAQDHPELRIKVLDPPTGPGGQYILGGCGYLSIGEKSQKKEAALEVVKYLVGAETLREFSKLILAKPVRQQPSNYYDGLSDPRMTAYMNASAAQAKHVKTTRILPYQPHEYLLGKINDYLLGRMGLDAMISDASKQIKQMAQAAK